MTESKGPRRPTASPSHGPCYPNIVVKSTLPIFGHLAFTLFDSDATHSFISEEFVEFEKLELEPLECTLTASTPADKYLTATYKVKDSSVTVTWRNLEASLVVRCMQDFNGILGMDWFGENSALIDCKAKKVIFRPLIGESIEFKGDTSNVVPRVITTLKARKLLYEGA